MSDEHERAIEHYIAKLTRTSGGNLEADAEEVAAFARAVSSKLSNVRSTLEHVIGRLSALEAGYETLTDNFFKLRDTIPPEATAARLRRALLNIFGDDELGLVSMGTQIKELRQEIGQLGNSLAGIESEVAAFKEAQSKQGRKTDYIVIILVALIVLIVIVAVVGGMIVWASN